MRVSRRTAVKSIVAAIASIALFRELPAVPAAAESFFIRAPIIVGHDLAVPQEYARFTSAIINAKQRGYNPASLDDILWTLVAGQPLKVDNPFVVTLDDGYISQLGILDFLANQGISATFYLIPGYQDGKHQYIPQENYGDLAEAGHALGAHTTRHIDLTNRSRMSLEEAVQDLLLSKQTVEDITGKEVNAAAYPFGRFNDALVAELSKYFVSIVSTAGGVLAYRRNRGSIPFRNSNIEHYPENVPCLNRVYAF